MKEREKERENRQNGVKNINLEHIYQTKQFIDIGAFKVSMSLIKETDMIWQKALLLHMHELYIFVTKYTAALICVWLFLLSSYITLVQL